MTHKKCFSGNLLLSIVQTQLLISSVSEFEILGANKSSAVSLNWCSAMFLGSGWSHTPFSLKTSLYTYTHTSKKGIRPGGTCLSGTQWSVLWSPLSVVMKLRGQRAARRPPSPDRGDAFLTAQTARAPGAITIKQQHSQTKPSLFYLGLLFHAAPTPNIIVFLHFALLPQATNGWNV